MEIKGTEQSLHGGVRHIMLHSLHKQYLRTQGSHAWWYVAHQVLPSLRTILQYFRKQASHGGECLIMHALLPPRALHEVYCCVTHLEKDVAWREVYEQSSGGGSRMGVGVQEVPASSRRFQEVSGGSRRFQDGGRCPGGSGGRGRW